AGEDEEPTDPEEPTEPEEPMEPEEPTEPEDPEATGPELTIESERIAVQDFVANGNSGKDRGVLRRVEGLEVGQEVNFEITSQGRNCSEEHTVIASGGGIAEWLVTRDNSISNGPPMGTYEVEATYGADKVLEGAFEVVPNLKNSSNGSN